MVGEARGVNRGELGAALRALWLASGKEAKTVTLGVSDDVKAQYLDAARAAATETTAWRLVRRLGVHKAQQQTRALESRMRRLQLSQPALVPGLLQTPEYIRAVLTRHDLSGDTLTRTAAARLARQQVLHDETKSLNFVITENVLRWRIVSPSRMAEQLDRLISLSRLPHISLRIVPFSVEQHDIANHAFVIRDARVVTVETVHAELVVTDPRDVAQYVDKFDGFSSVAVLGDDMRRMIESVRDDFLRGHRGPL
ncbi:DUF5753 domain-containing protein [Streptomyces antioxidans]|uniref:DUF5753 domain-containing protein n=1 Tax=Streptomyces antioxidans TaxID=1507734 RepID=UPI00069F65DA|nr:DUF5753 domain-containing protein [Streptomyces antioxidans]